VTSISSAQTDLTELVASHPRLVLLFWASWCPHCRRFRPVFEAAAAAHPDLDFASFQVDADGADETLLDDLGLSSVPATLFFAGGVWIDSVFGEQSAADLDDALGRLRLEPVSPGAAEPVAVG
jgi:thiol-disulfide isomerase/thioredoxin